jgi:hypothetical protein
MYWFKTLNFKEKRCGKQEWFTVPSFGGINSGTEVAEGLGASTLKNIIGTHSTQ